MTYQDALKVVNNKGHLIGTSDDDQFIIGDIAIIPANEIDRNNFFKNYVITQNWRTSIIPYLDGQMMVWAIDTYHLNKDNILFYKDISNQ